ncbi:MAG: tyrosine-type recombinase/integrase [Lachnospiraceae bacterium]|nr:tyrosine-type recombinase/integrase [Lachnospiraceae bacterium]
METIGSTGIRISELCFITVEAVRQGIARIYNKGKVRKVILTRELCRQLLLYIAENKIKSGPVFVSRNGNTLNRSNIWKEMKELAERAGVAVTKVFPHNLRKLFASCLYKEGRDIARVADILGHSRIDTTRRYIRETCEQQRNILEKLGLVETVW